MKTMTALAVAATIALLIPIHLASGDDPATGTAPAGTAGTAAAPTETAKATAKPAAKPEKEVENPFIVGEKVHYTVTFCGIPAGTAVLEVHPPVDYKGHQAIRIKLSTRSYKAFDAIYKVKDDIETIIDKKTFLPYFFRKKLNEGKRQQEEFISFDQEKHEAVFFKKKKGEKTFKRNKPIKIPPNTHDPLSSLLYFRTLDMKVGQTIKMSVCTRRKTWDLEIKVEKKEKKRLRGVGTWTCYHIVPKYKFDGLFIKSGRADIWVEEETKIPILMEVTLPIGFAEIRLEKVEYLEKDKEKKEGAPAEKEGPKDEGK